MFRDATWQLFPDAATLERMATGETSVLLSEEQGHDRLTVVTPDVPGAFSKVAGVLALHGIDVTGARRTRRSAARRSSNGSVSGSHHSTENWRRVATRSRRPAALEVN